MDKISEKVAQLDADKPPSNNKGDASIWELGIVFAVIGWMFGAGSVGDFIATIFDFNRPLSIVLVFLFFFIGFAILVRMLHGSLKEVKRRKTNRFITLAYLTFATIFLVIPTIRLVYLVISNIHTLANYLIQKSDDQTVRLYLFIGVSAIGAGAFFFRLKWMRLYGLSEIVFALGVVWTQAPDVVLRNRSSVPEETWSRIGLTMVTAGIYLIVRGLDNMDKGRTQNREWEVKFLKRFEKYIPFIIKHVAPFVLKIR